MQLDPRTPVIVGVGQFLNRVDHGADAMEPTDLALEAINLARADCGGAGDTGAPGNAGAQRDLAASADVIAYVPTVSWRYQDPGRIIADAVGATTARTWYPAIGGNTPMLMLNRLARSIAAGEMDTGVLCGAEAGATRSTMRRAGERPDWYTQDESVVPDWGTEDVFVMGHPAEHAKGILMPIQAYPLFETALLHAGGRGLKAHIATVAKMWEGFSAVAADNPWAWDRTAHDAHSLVTPSPTNRYVGWPYTKAMVSNPDVDMASAVIITTVERATAAGVPRDRWVFPLAGTDAKDKVMSLRASFDRSPAIGACLSGVLELADTTVGEIDHLDVYACFPSAVQLFCAEAGISPVDRPLTVHGGLAFAGGPWNNPVGHAIATMVHRLRGEPGTTGLVTANGGNVDKHSFGLFSTEPPASGYQHRDVQDVADQTIGREVLVDYDGPATLETWTVMHSRHEVPERFHGSALTPTGERVWVTSDDADTMAAAMAGDVGGTEVSVEAGGTITL